MKIKIFGLRLRVSLQRINSDIEFYVFDYFFFPSKIAATCNSGAFKKKNQKKRYINSSQSQLFWGGIVIKMSFKYDSVGEDNLYAAHKVQYIVLGSQVHTTRITKDNRGPSL